MSQFGWMITNSTQNIGDDFQCIAAKQFIGDIPMEKWIDREKLKEYSQDEIYLIANGWYMHEPLNWPPSSKIVPLLTSIHISNTRQKNGRIPSEFILSKESVGYLQEHSPVGGRDTFTVRELEKVGVKTYFSGCLTMTLQKLSEERKEYICLVDPTRELEEFIRKKTKREIVIVRPERSDWPENYSERIERAKKLLKVYGEAHLVITSRLHGALPSLAMNTPVLLLEGKFGDERFEGLKYFVNLCTFNDLYSGKYPLNIEHPIDNPKEYLVLRKNLEEIVKAFVNKELDIIDFKKIDKDNRTALSEARSRTIKFNKKYHLESIKIREFKNKLRFIFRIIQNTRKG